MQLDRRSLLGIAGLVLGTSGTAVAVQMNNSSDSPSKEDVSLTEQEARDIATGEVDGSVLEVELEREDGTPVYEIEVEASDGTVHEVVVHADEGTVLEVEAEDDEDEDNDEKGEEDDDDEEGEDDDDDEEEEDDDETETDDDE